MEMTGDGIDELSKQCAHELVGGDYIQSRKQMLRHPDVTHNNHYLTSILEEWIKL